MATKRKTGRKFNRFYVKELAHAFGLQPTALSRRLRLGWNIRDALTKDVQLTANGEVCLGVGERNGQCGAPFIAHPVRGERYCAECNGIMDRWGAELRAA